MNTSIFASLQSTAIGLIPVDQLSIHSMPGWNSGSVGYHGENGAIHNNHIKRLMSVESFGVGDTVGLLWDLRYGSISYTLNGNFLGMFHSNVTRPMYPVIGIQSPNTSVRVNFGHSRFRFKEFERRLSRLSLSSITQIGS